MLLDYLYRDASNYKSFGSVQIKGDLSEAERRNLLSCLESGEFFVAEQVGIPPLYGQLARYGGDGGDDHSWHTLVGFREALTSGERPEATVVGSEILKRFRLARGNWRPEISPNFLNI